MCVQPDICHCLLSYFTFKTLYRVVKMIKRDNPRDWGVSSMYLKVIWPQKLLCDQTCYHMTQEFSFCVHENLKTCLCKNTNTYIIIHNSPRVKPSSKGWGDNWTQGPVLQWLGLYLVFWLTCQLLIVHVVVTSQSATQPWLLTMLEIKPGRKILCCYHSIISLNF